MFAVFFLILIFLLIILLLGLKRPLYQAMLAGILATVLFFQIAPSNWWSLIRSVFVDWGSFSILLSLYLITYLQRILEEKEQIKKAERDLDGIFHNRRVNTMVAPLFIGLLPSAAAMLLCGDIVTSTTDGYLKRKDQAFLTTWVRHVPEAFLPTYPAVLLMSTLSGVPVARFMLAMLPIITFLLLVVYWKYIRQIPRKPDTPKSSHPWKAAVQLLKHLWTLILMLVLMIVLGLGVVPAALITIVLALLVYRLSLKQGVLFLKTAFEGRLIGNMFLVLVFKVFLDSTGVLASLPKLLQGLPIPSFLIFVLLFFLGGVISGASGIIALGTPIAFAAVPDGGVALMVLLMATTHAASQVSPTHICLTVVSEYYDTSLLQLMKKTLPYSFATIVFALCYYLLLGWIG
ncbi:DUF401 family protein [Streptococcus sp. DD13]|uniref:DUF401 family protein n=1 Tax=Streptococcus sp. DD13 TaxID=1777881 RepID=UPI00079B0C98|nr:DUF401 family protein [Streptococcus sp. DD13]KXT77925.1 hypothetical protein STRDD13_01188 [Streptococcus sp. DD13]